MLNTAEDIDAYPEAGSSLIGPGWREVPSFEDMDNDQEYESEEEVCKPHHLSQCPFCGCG